MRLLLRAVPLLWLLFAGVVYGQTTVPPFKHVVIIFQENRTPDNLFGSAPRSTDCTQENPFEPGVDVADGGKNKWSTTGKSCSVINPGLLTGGSDHCHNCKDQHHQNAEYAGWVPQCDYDPTSKTCKMDGASHSWEDPNHNSEFQYVDRPAVQPYFDIATNYGFANYMFSTHQGPSFEGHQFIFGGSSAPVFPGQTDYDWFVAENPGIPLGQQVGCPATGSGSPKWVDPDGTEQNFSTWCYDRNTLVTYQDNQGVHDWTASWAPSTPQPAWKYYMPTGKDDPNSAIWNGPEDDPQTCYFSSSGGGTACNSAEYTTHISVADSSHMLSAPILTDIQNCHLPAISWVIPDERWSDHPGDAQNYTGGLGPDWVAAIVNAIGQSWQKSLGGGHCDYWGYGNNSATPEPTAIFITWDDWGGFYDHVPPPKVYQGDQNDKCPATQDNPNGWGCGYVYGFRVPLMVVSNWTPAGYVSGRCGGTNPPCPNLGQNNEWTHDFGSILAFTENNFTQQGLTLPPIAPQTPVKYTYADQNSLDATYNHQPAVPLWDFFQGPQRTFTQVNPVDSAHTAGFFQSYYQTQQADGTYPQPIGPEAGDPMD